MDRVPVGNVTHAEKIAQHAHMCIYTQLWPPNGPACHWTVAVQRQKKNLNEQKVTNSIFLPTALICRQQRGKKKAACSIPHPTTQFLVCERSVRRQWRRAQNIAVRSINYGRIAFFSPSHHIGDKKKTNNMTVWRRKKRNPSIINGARRNILGASSLPSNRAFTNQKLACGARYWARGFFLFSFLHCIFCLE